MRTLYRWLIGLHIFIGIGAAAGGIAAVTDPESPMGMPVEMLESSPFESFMIPGLFLLIVLGLGNITLSILTIKKIRYHGVASGIMGVILILWIVIQCYVLQTVGGLHIAYFCLGIIQGLLSFVLIYRLDEFPLNLLKKMFHIKVVSDENEIEG